MDAHSNATPSRISLAQIHVANPCPADWSAMSGDDAKRFCAHCQKHVHDLDAMTRDAAEALVCSSAGSLCIRYQADAEGRPAMLNYAPTKTVSRLRRWTPFAAISMAFTTAAIALGIQWKKPATPPAMMVVGMMGPVPVRQPANVPPPMGRMVIGEASTTNQSADPTCGTNDIK